MLISRFDSHVRDKAKFYDPAKHGIPAEIYGSLAMCGEAGELAGKIKKEWRDRNGEFSETKRMDCLDELGDILWYLTYTAHCLGFSLSEVMNRNIIKLNDRARRRVQAGDGDHR